MNEIGPGMLLVLALLVVAAVPSMLLTSVGVRLLRRRSPQPRVLRRCDNCGSGWKAEPAVTPWLPGLQLRRVIRHRLRAREGAAIPAWCRPQGFARCPSCLSRRVRTPGEPRTRPSALPLLIVGVLFVLLGFAALALTVLGRAG